MKTYKVSLLTLTKTRAGPESHWVTYVEAESQEEAKEKASEEFALKKNYGHKVDTKLFKAMII